MRYLYLTTLLLVPNFLIFAQPGTQTDVISINSYQTFRGYDETQPHTGQGEYQIFYDNIDGVFNKPIVIVDGYDPTDGRNIQAIYDSFNYNSGANNYLADWRNQGFDMVILNFPTYTRISDGATINGGADYIERNGLILVNLLLSLSPQLPSANDFVVFGPSMGGLVSRYALRFMEQNSLDHRTGLWFSFDSPHFGANVPIGLQYLFNYFVETNGTADEQAQKDLILNNPAARQMLLDHYVAHLQSGSEYLQNSTIQLPTPHPFRTTFMNTINDMGFPTQPRNVSISNGVMNGTGTSMPGAQVVNTTLDMGSGVTTQIRLHYTPAANISNYEVDFLQNYFFGFPVGNAFTTVAASPSTTSGYDTAPGSTQSVSLIFGENPTGILGDFVDALQVDAFCFIPTVSSLAVSNANIYNPIVASDITQFDTYFVPTVNEIHMTYTQPTIDFITNEILNHYLSAQHLELSNLKLKQNPVYQEIVLQNTSITPQKFEYKIVNSRGQIIVNGEFISQHHELSIPIDLNSGFYMLSINNATFYKTFKIIVQ